ncbi:hypothetical protein BJ322DRAFT_997290 [Thelephora terrestris]|uniref:Postreplication repair E3 ubiquitin-protein ligase RAD18 n=1 Tax=Thelephora terrestris TaxID=56493 RepID=A0A9P6HRH5_9AGAM|nr:hypothetical protein BJ322DRAFT_997290 [Thelephora terrestris]
MSKRNHLQSLLDSGITDPSDFPQRELGDLDSSLTCKICREFYRGPVSLACGHCFCSMCIRNSMTSKQECPVCRKSANEGQIRPMVALEEVIESWKAARCVVGLITLSHTIGALILNLATATDGSSRSTPDRTLSNVAGPSTPSKKRKLDSKDGESMIDCPICHTFVPFDTINVHIDNGCKSTSTPSKPKQKAEWSKVFSKKSKDSTQESDPDHRLPKLNYHTMKEKQIRELLSQAELSTTGDKNALMARHQQWTMLYNANQDRSANQRQDMEQLRKELKKWEGEGKAKKVDIGDTDEYQVGERTMYVRLVLLTDPTKRLHKQDFVELIERARRSKPPSRKYQSSQQREGEGLVEALKPVDPIEVD